MEHPDITTASYGGSYIATVTEKYRGQHLAIVIVNYGGPA
jgi:hypothetical protein